jgi:hypothetical protein
MMIDWNNKWVEFKQKGNKVKLQVLKEDSVLQVCEEVELQSEWRPQSELLVAQVWVCEDQTISKNIIRLELMDVLSKYAVVFETPNQLPPCRDIDHTIPLLPNSKPMNLRPYRYSHYQKLELDAIIEELLRTSVIRLSSSPFASPALLVKKKDET